MAPPAQPGVAALAPIFLVLAAPALLFAVSASELPYDEQPFQVAGVALAVHFLAAAALSVQKIAHARRLLAAFGTAGAIWAAVEWMLVPGADYVWYMAADFVVFGGLLPAHLYLDRGVRDYVARTNQRLFDG